MTAPAPQGSAADVVDLADLGGRPSDPSRSAHQHNAALLNSTLRSLRPGRTLLIRGTYHTSGGIVAHNLTDAVVRLDGRLVFSSETRRWPRRPSGRRRVLDCLHLVNPVNVTLTSGLGTGADGGVLDGNGAAWWGLPGLGYLRRGEDRPRLLRVTNGTDVLMENWLLLDPPYWAATFDNVTGLEVRHVGIQARRTSGEGHGLVDLTAFNTDGIDVSGRDVWVHDVNVWTQDDSVAVKGCPRCAPDGVADAASRDMLFERINASGLGLTVGSIGNYSSVRNVTFRDSILYRSYKGIYMKVRRSNATLVEDVLYENIFMEEPEQWPIWIGPAQQSDSRNLCRANPCSICWPAVPGAECRGQKNATYRNITLRNVTIRRPRRGGGVIMADPDFPIDGIVFDGVRVDPCESGGGGEEGGDSRGPRAGPPPLSPSETFPLLPPYVRRDGRVELFQFLLFALVLLLGTALLRWAASCSSHPRWRRRRTLKASAAAAAASAVAVPLASRAAWLSLRMGRPDSYFACGGVTGGVATGGTWPAPSCFRDDGGGASASAADDGDNGGGGASALGAGRADDGAGCRTAAAASSLDPAAGAMLTAAALLLAAAAAVALSWRSERRDPMGRYFVELPQMSADDEGDGAGAPVRLTEAEEEEGPRSGSRSRSRSRSGGRTRMRRGRPARNEAAAGAPAFDSSDESARPLRGGGWGDGEGRGPTEKRGSIPSRSRQTDR